MKKWLGLLLLLALVCACCAAWAEEGRTVGQTPPAFSFTDTDGNTVTLEQLQEGKKLVVVEFFATWSDDALEAFPGMAEVCAKYEDQMSFVLLAGPMGDSLEMLKDYKERHQLPFTVGSVQGDVVDFVDLSNVPTHLFIDRYGKVACLYETAFLKPGLFENIVGYLLADDYDGQPIAAYSARVFKEDGTPVPGAEVSFIGAEETIRQTTDEKGLACLPISGLRSYEIRVTGTPEGLRTTLDAYMRTTPDTSYALLNVKDSTLMDLSQVPETAGLNVEGPYTLENIRNYVVGLDQPITLADGTTRPAINFDNAATTPALSPVMDEVNRQLYLYGSIGRGFSQKSNHSTEMYEITRDKVLAFLNADPKRYTCFYVNNTTDGLNKLASALITSKEDIVLTTRMEHHANDLSWRERCKVIYAEVDAQGRIIYDDIEKLLKENQVSYVSVTAASNVTGYVTDVHRVAKLAHQYGAKIIVDGAQIVAHRAFSMLGDTEEENIDFFVFSAHKMYSPYGGGAVVGLTEILDDHMPQFYGGGTITIVGDTWQNYKSAPARYEAGSPNYPGVVGLGKAIDILREVGFDSIQAHEQALNRRLIDGLRAMDHAVIYGDTEDISDRVGVVTFNFDNVNSYLLAQRLAALGGVATRRGAFCANPYVWRLLGVADDELEEYLDCSDMNTPGMIRVSFGIYNTEEEVDALLSILPQAIEAAQNDNEELEVSESY